MEISKRDWKRYIDRLSAIDKKAADTMQFWMQENPDADVEELIWVAQNVAGRYGEAAGALACEMYDAVAVAQGAAVPPAEIADIPDYGETAKAVRGTLKNKQNTVPATVGRLVKRVGADTMLKNADRDHAQFAWVPMGDTCAFCLTLASRGWQYMSKNAMKNGHAEHIHANCDCTYAVRFDERSSVSGYDPDYYQKIYDDAEGDTPQEKINSMRREIAAKKKELTSNGGGGILKSSLNKGELLLDDIQVGRSVGALRKSYDIKDLKTGERFDLVDGSHLEKVRVFAGKGVKTPYRNAWKYARKHPGTKAEDWQHVKAYGTINYYGEPRRAEIHWSQCEEIGIDDMFVKEWLE